MKKDTNEASKERKTMEIYDSIRNQTYFQKRRRRRDGTGGARELTFSCYRRFPFLLADRTRHWFVDAVEQARREFPLDIWAYVLMPEHVHLLVYPREPQMKLGPVVGAIKESVGRLAIQYLREHAPHWLDKLAVQEGTRVRHRFWQPGGGYDRNAIELDTVHAMIDYIHANPVRRGLVDSPQQWIWSSARWYAGETDVPLKMDRTIPMLHS